MNLRNVGDYNIGLDIGTGSVGWSVTDAEGNLLYFKGKPTWGSRIFPSAMPASEARAPRSQRRRIARRRWRLDLLESLFQQAVKEVDPDFFVRLRQTHLLKEDRSPEFQDHAGMIFADEDFSERDYFKRFPTIYHLRLWLMQTDEKADIRLIYLAFHNIVKHRGNFLQQENERLSSENSSVEESVENFCLLLQNYCDELGVSCSAQEAAGEIARVLGDTNSSKSHLQEQISKQFGIGEEEPLDKQKAKKMAKALGAALVGLKADMEHIFFLHGEKPEGLATNIYLSNDEQVEAFLEACPDEGRPLFEAMQAVYSSYVLQGILSSAPGKCISANKVADYEQYGKDLRLLKTIVKEHASKEKYDEFFRGGFCTPTPLHPQKYVYDKYGKDAIRGYTRYNADHKTRYEDFKKEVEALFKDTAAVTDERYCSMMERFGREKFLRRLKTSDNGAIPFQLHLEEMRAIIDNQAVHYPFLEQQRGKLESLVSFRIPYYVGPLTLKNAQKDAAGKTRFAWSVRQEGKENERVYPWNWEEIIDKDESAAAFIQRMTSTCTYLQGEPVLPKCSLLYEEYCVLNELNGVRLTQDGDREHRLDYQDRADAMEQLFHRGRVSYKKFEDWLKKRGVSNPHLSGAQGEAGFESKMSSYIFFAKDVFGVDGIPLVDYPMIEEIILWSTLFEDRGIFREKLKRTYGDRLNDEQIKTIVRKRFTGWGKLSRKLLTELKVNTDCGPRSIMDVLREGNPNSDRPSRAMVLMEVLHDDSLDFESAIEEHNSFRMAEVGPTLEELPGSPALRRSVKQARDIVDEIVRIAGHAPANIFVEVTREEDDRKKGQRTTRRYAALLESMEALKAEAPELWDAAVAKELSDRSKKKTDLSEKLTLYFMQGGKSLYSGKPLDIERLSEYQVDHIIPRSYIKDDSFENKALVLASENQAKSDQMLLDASVRRKMRPYWDALHEAKLIGDKKHRNLNKEYISDQQMKGFIARQLVETSQILKAVQSLLRDTYVDTRIVPVKAALSSELRGQIGLVKCREANDFHHAHDALLASEIGRFILKRHAGMYENPIGYTHIMRDYVKCESSAARKGKAPGTASFVIASFMRSGFDEETGELFKDDWSASEEVARLKRYFNYRQCFISRMPEETSGAFWNETIYSPRGGKKKASIPLKKQLDVHKYGGYSGSDFAYFIFIAGVDAKGKPQRMFSGVPIPVAQRISNGELLVEDYAQDIASQKGLSEISILRSRVLKYSKVEYGGDEFYLAAEDAVLSSRQLYVSSDYSALLRRICDMENIGDEAIALDDLMDAYNYLIEKCSILCAKFANIKQALLDGRSAFCEMAVVERRKLIKSVLSFFLGKTARVDLLAIGGAKNAGGIRNNFLRSSDQVVIVDQSVTGMFERRTHIGL